MWLDERAHGAGRFHRLEQAEPLDRRHARGLDEVRAHPLVGLRVGLFLDDGDAKPGAAELDRGGAAGEAAADDDRVVRRAVADDGGMRIGVGHLGASNSLPGNRSSRTIRHEL